MPAIYPIQDCAPVGVPTEGVSAAARRTEARRAQLAAMADRRDNAREAAVRAAAEREATERAASEREVLRRAPRYVVTVRLSANAAVILPGPRPRIWPPPEQT
jgi:hypothetical protein